MDDNKHYDYCSVCRATITDIGQPIGPDCKELTYGWNTCSPECARTAAIINEMQEDRRSREMNWSG